MPTHHGVERLLAEIKRLRGYIARTHPSSQGSFDWFRTLAAWHDEEAHTQVIAALLNPSAEHNMGLTFLQHLLQELELPISEGSNPSDWTVTAEKPLKGQETRSPGRIDVLIEGPDCVVGIENKVRAPISSDQLVSYARAISGKGKQHTALILLTATSTSAEPPTNHGEEWPVPDVRLLRMSYAPPLEETDSQPSEPGDDDEDNARCHPSLELTQWLSRCIESASLVPRVREALAQYRETAMYVGGHTMSQSEQDTIAETLSADSHNFESAMAIGHALSKAKAQVQHSFWSALHDRLIDDPAIGSRNVRGSGFDIESLQEYYKRGIQGRPTPSIEFPPRRPWFEKEELIQIGLLPDSNRPYVTIKLLRARSQTASDASNEAKELTAAASHELYPMQFNDSGWSYITGDLLLPRDRSRLDLTHFSGRATGLADDDTCRGIVNEMIEVIRKFDDVVDRVRTNLPGDD